jgi:hypothetical protein
VNEASAVLLNYGALGAICVLLVIAVFYLGKQATNTKSLMEDIKKLVEEIKLIHQEQAKNYHENIAHERSRNGDCYDIVVEKLQKMENDHKDIKRDISDVRSVDAVEINRKLGVIIEFLGANADCPMGRKK